VGYTVMILFYVVMFIAPDALGLHHVLLKYDSTIPYTYSDMNGYMSGSCAAACPRLNDLTI
jgi:hypothetical protein